MTSKPPDILHVLAPAPFGGLESVVQLLTTGLAARGHNVGVAAIIEGDTHPFVASLEDAGISVTPMRLTGRSYAAHRRAFRNLLEVRRPRIVHTHGYLTDVLDIGVARTADIPTVSTLHGFTGSDRKQRVYEWLQCRSVRRASAAVAVSRGIAERLRRTGTPEARVHMIPNAYAPRTNLPDRDAARSVLGLEPNRTHIGWIGRLSPEKGADVLIDALDALRDLPVSLSLIGDGADRAMLESRAHALGVADRIRFHGTVPDVGSLMRAFDVVALSSRTEGTPMVLLEAMAAEIPVVATCVGGIPDVVSHGDAWLVPSEQPRALAGAIRAALTDRDDARARAASAAARLRSTYAIEPWLARYEQLYASLLTPHASIS